MRSAEERPQLVGRQQIAAAGEHDRGADLFAEAVVGHPEHAALGHGVVFEDRGLDLGAVDVLATAQHHVLGAVDDVDEPVVVHAGDVAGVQPPVGDGLGGGLGLVQVALDDLGALDPQLAHPADGQRLAVGVDDLGLEARHRRSRAVGTIDEEVGADGGDDAAGLGHAVAGGRAVRWRRSRRSCGPDRAGAALRRRRATAGSRCRGWRSRGG